MKVSQRGLYALRSLLHLAERYADGGVVKVHEIAEAEEIPEKFLEGILVTLKNARFVDSERGREGGYRLKRPPGEIVLSDVVRLVDGPLAPFGDAAELARRIRTEALHPSLFELFLAVRDAAAAILDNTTLADLVSRDRRVRGRAGARGAGRAPASSRRRTRR